MVEGYRKELEKYTALGDQVMIEEMSRLYHMYKDLVDKKWAGK